jgi:hypothetical protein
MFALAVSLRQLHRSLVRETLWTKTIPQLQWHDAVKTKSL